MQESNESRKFKLSVSALPQPRAYHFIHAYYMIMIIIAPKIVSGRHFRTDLLFGFCVCVPCVWSLIDAHLPPDAPNALVRTENRHAM